jgi:hypothetical protein
MIESGVTGPMLAIQRNFTLARRHSGPNNPHPQANKNSRQTSRLLLDTPLSSSMLFANSTRHSVTSRIQRNSRLLRNLTFSTRHLNATLQKCNLVEKFNTSSHLEFRSGALEYSNRWKIPPGPNARPKVRPKSVTYISGTDCYPCLRAGPSIGRTRDSDSRVVFARRI